MKFNLFKSESKLAFPRCEHRSPSGRQCSQPVCSTDPRFCGTHKPTPEQVTAAELTEAAGTLSSPDEVHRFLKAVLLNRVRGRITPKEASVYSYLCQNLLRSLREIDHFRELQSEREECNIPPELQWHLPRPDRSDPPACPEQREGACPEQSEGSPPPAQTPENSAINSAATDSATVGAALGRLPLPAETPAEIAPPVSSSATIPSASDATRASSPVKPAISIAPPAPNPPFDPRHFYPFDPTLRIGTQNPDRNIPPPDEAECRRLAARRGLLFTRRPSGALR